MSIQKRTLQPRKPKAQRKPRQGFTAPANAMQGLAYVNNWKPSKHAKGRKA